MNVTSLNVTILNDLGATVTYSPIEHALPPKMIASLPGACARGGSNTHQWAAIRRRAPLTLRVGILGCSTTAGCGSLSPSGTCFMPLSWGRRFHDALSNVLQTRFAIETHVRC